MSERGPRCLRCDHASVQRAWDAIACMAVFVNAVCWAECVARESTTLPGLYVEDPRWLWCLPVNGIGGDAAGWLDQERIG